MATATKVKLSSEMQYLNERLKDGRAVLHSGFSMKRLGNPDPAFQPRVVHLDMQHVKDLDDIYQARGFLDAVVIFHIAEEDRHILVDGFHRHEVYKRAGEEAIPAYVIEGSVEDAVEYAAMANQHAILKRTKADIKKQVFLLMSIPKWFGMSDTEIGRHVGVGYRVVSRHRLTYCAENSIPVPERDVTSGRKFRDRPLSRKKLFRDDAGAYRAFINRKSTYIGKNIAVEDAVRIRDEKQYEAEQKRRNLDSSAFFYSWLIKRGIVLGAHGLHPSRYPNIGMAGVGRGRIVITARLDVSSSAIYTAIGRLYALREALERPGDRLVMVCVCYPDDGPEALVEVARRLGVELLTPEELVTSIKGDGDGEQGAVGPVGDGGDGTPTPNAETQQVIRDARAGKNLNHYANPEEMFDAQPRGDGASPAGEADRP